MRRAKRTTLRLERVELFGIDEHGNEWKIEAEQALIRLQPSGDFRAVLRRRNPWGECHARIIHLGIREPVDS